ncbi:hypothetical protein L195_g013493 [Trifolium pratense]|uniref:Uncharacterized protein n=1 Tax=Trifolium pratense TaxID=57577 RepID=A0A2K3PNA7_TRIPR|nr:hypothetical protein L195_g013493 [Trifolium pratense]
MLSGGPNMPIFDVHWTTSLSGYYKLNVDAAHPIEGGTRLRSSTSFSYEKGLEFAKDLSFVNLIAESNASNVILASTNRRQSSHYVGSIIEDYI